jgi:hypothetical protein
VIDQAALKRDADQIGGTRRSELGLIWVHVFTAVL